MLRCGAVGADFSTVPISALPIHGNIRAVIQRWHRCRYSAESDRVRVAWSRPAQQPCAGDGRLQLEAVRRVGRVPAGQLGDLVQPVGQRADGQVQRPGAERGVAAGGEVRLQGLQQRLGATPGGGQRGAAPRPSTRASRSRRGPAPGAPAGRRRPAPARLPPSRAPSSSASWACSKDSRTPRRPLLGLADAHPPGPDLGGPAQLARR